MRLELTAVFEQVPEGYIAWVPEIPGANTQGTTLEEARANLEEAVLLVLETNRMLADQFGGGDSQIRETLLIQRREAA
jgi:predicted RNase H-like HicB family nuclease